MRLLTVADGFGETQTFPPWYPDFFKWPEIIQLMTKGTVLTNLSINSTGNEYISYVIKHNIENKDTVLVQWAAPNRLDLLLDHPTNKEFWDSQISLDPRYNQSVATVNDHRFWLSSFSKNPDIRNYHEKYITLTQHHWRSRLFIDYVTLLLETRDIKYGFLLTVDSDYINESDKDFSNWYWHSPFKGMQDFRKISRYADLDTMLSPIQPISLVQFDFIKNFIMPKFDLNWRNDREIDAVENMLYRKTKQAIELKNDWDQKTHG